MIAAGFDKLCNASPPAVQSRTSCLGCKAWSTCSTFPSEVAAQADDYNFVEVLEYKKPRKQVF
jgi:hypothetical protein